MELSAETVWAYLPPSEVKAIRISAQVYEDLQAENYLLAGQVEVGWASHYRNQGKF